MSCIHKFRLLGSNTVSETVDNTRTRFTRLDFFFCQKCLKYEEVRRTEVIAKFANANYAIPPLWYKAD